MLTATALDIVERNINEPLDSSFDNVSSEENTESDESENETEAGGAKLPK